MMARRAEDYIFNGVVVVPPHVAARLATLVSSELRQKQRDNDPDVYAVLVALRMVSLQYGKLSTRSGTPFATEAEPTTGLDLGVAAAADLMRISRRGVRKACEAQRLPARRVDGRWLISSEDAQNYHR
ncbi:helix-turn-helix domain-containing protein [Jatrophihabitans lederbergiae]|uniref:Helix-turn-helix domain-containing protein n=1 Tax=Jatrophihabitans lederbergiae TaxID=3075547 RepID=A0ABU2JG57_9ACTN|nr:helix-turn-helix domain-containing protein [Jatrophihabitans sp. DSM 44399]MDT0263980.1 helix-turn-helix domain-containing protein [Jatrophihabitans sp. DSM 44399]